MSRQGLDRKKRSGSAPENLTKRERVLRTLAGKEVDRRPFTFWYSFGLNYMKGESLAAAALTFAANYSVDLLRFPAIRDLPIQDQASLDRPHDLTQLEVLSGQEGFWLQRIEAFREAQRLSEKRVAIFESIPGPYTALSYLCRPELLAQAESNHPGFLEKGMETMTESYKNYLRGLLNPDLIDGLVVEIESATYAQREPEEFKSLVKPYLKELLNFVTSESQIPIWLHIRGTRLYVKPLLDLPHQMLSWPHLSQGPSLEKVLPKGYKGIVAGGIDEQAILDMSFQDIRRHIEEARDLRVNFFSIGDHLNSDVSQRRLTALSNFLTKRDRLPEKDQPKPR